MINDPVNTHTIPTKFARKTVVFDEKYHWLIYKPGHNIRQPNPCTDCNRVFYGDDGKMILKLHRIINHIRVINYG